MSFRGARIAPWESHWRKSIIQEIASLHFISFAMTDFLGYNLPVIPRRILCRVSGSETRSSTEQSERQFCDSKIKWATAECGTIIRKSETTVGISLTEVYNSRDCFTAFHSSRNDRILDVNYCHYEERSDEVISWRNDFNPRDCHDTRNAVVSRNNNIVGQVCPTYKLFIHFVMQIC